MLMLEQVDCWLHKDRTKYEMYAYAFEKKYIYHTISAYKCTHRWL